MNKKQWKSLFEKNDLEVIDFFPKQDKVIHFSIYNYDKYGYMRWAHMHLKDDGKYFVKLFWQTEMLGELHEEESILDDDEYIFRVISGFLDGNLEICKEDIAEEQEILEKKEEKIERWEQMSLF